MPSAAGGGLDRTARTVHRIWQERKLFAAPSAVVNKPGGSGSIGYTYLSGFGGDAHYVSISSPTLLTNHILGTGRFSHTDFTPLALLSSEFLMLSVRTESPIRNGRDMIERLRKDPAALSVAIGSVIGVASPQRLTGALASVPTWKEQGVDVVADTWRGMVGPKGLNTAQIAFWDQTLSRMVASDEWKKDVEKNLWVDSYRSSAETRKFLESEHAELKAVLTELGLAR